MNSVVEGSLIVRACRPVLATSRAVAVLVKGARVARPYLVDLWTVIRSLGVGPSTVPRPDPPSRSASLTAEVVRALCAGVLWAVHGSAIRRFWRECGKDLETMDGEAWSHAVASALLVAVSISVGLLLIRRATLLEFAPPVAVGAAAAYAWLRPSRGGSTR